MVETVTSLSTPPVVGRCYRVPTIAYPWLFLDLPRRWPVFLPKHRDELLDFPHAHYHVDPRFLGPTQVNEARRYCEQFYVRHLCDLDAARALASPETATAFVAGASPLSRGMPGGGHHPHPPLEWRTIRCRRAVVGYEHPGIAEIVQEAFAGRACRRIRSGLLCPHQGFPLGSIAPNAAGEIVCPLHGLRIDAATGVALELTP